MVKPQIQKQEISFLNPSQETLKITGKLFYSEGDQSWNVIRLKKEILHKFPQLKEKSSKFSYQMVVPQSSDEIKDLLKEVRESIPILLFLCREKNEK